MYVPIFILLTAFKKENRALENDLAGEVPADMIEMMKSFGMFGFQVPEDYGGLGLSNVQMARMSEIGGEIDLGTSLHIGAHQSIGFKVSWFVLEFIFTLF